MLNATNFPFITDGVLRRNMDAAFVHLTELAFLSGLAKYGDASKSSFRKTAIVYTASIIEAMLLWYLKSKFPEASLKRESKIFKITKDIYNINELEKIVLGKYVQKTENVRFSKLNLADINNYCREKGIINHTLYKDVEVVRKLRNRLHIGTLSVIETDYSKADLEFVFSIAKRVKHMFSLVSER